MALPEASLKEFLAETGAPPEWHSRALYDLEGNLGETHLALGGDWLFLFSRRLGASPVTLPLCLSEIERFDIQTNGAFTTLALQALGRRVELKLTRWETPALESMRRKWRAVRGDQPESEPLPLRPSGAWSPLPSRLDPEDPGKPLLTPLFQPTPWVGFCAALHAMIQADGEADPGELRFLAEAMPNPDLIELGAAWLAEVGVEHLPEALAQLLNREQARCLWANALAVALADGRYRPVERAFLGRLATALALDPAESERIGRVILIRNNLAVFTPAPVDPNPEPGEPGPLEIYCGMLVAVSLADGDMSRTEVEALWRLVDNPGAQQRGSRLQQETDLDGLLELLPKCLTGEQGKCLLANAVALSLADGVLRSSEQELLGRICAALGLEEAVLQEFQEVLVLRHELGVFGDPAAFTKTG